MSWDLVVALSGGIGGGKLALGLSRIVEPSSRPLTRAVSAAGVTLSAEAAWTSEPAAAIA